MKTSDQTIMPSKEQDIIRTRKCMTINKSLFVIISGAVLQRGSGACPTPLWSAGHGRR